MIKIKNYSIQKNDQEYFIKNLSLNIEEGSILGIIGKSGSGKTLLALAIAGITQTNLKTTGEIKRNNIENISILFQNPLSQIFSTKVYDEIKNTLHLSSQDITEESIINISNKWSINNILNKPIDKLSLGEAQKVAIASIMISNPDLIILDEPFQYVDNSTFHENLLNIKKHNPKITVIIIEHNYYMLNLIADKILKLKLNSYEIHKEITNPKIKSIFLNSLQNKISITFLGIHFSYGKLKVLKDFYFKLDKSFLIIDGKNGTGKSTLVKILTRLLKPKKGNVIYYLDNKKIINPKLKNIRDKIGYIFQNPDYQIFANTVKEEIFYGLSNPDKVYINYWINKFNLTNLLDKSPHTLSYGERRRVNFLSATAHLPKIIIYDEPTVGLDYENRAILLEFIKYHNKQGAIQILISHDRWFKTAIKGDVERIKL